MRGVVDAERRVLVLADVGVDPGDAFLGVPFDHRAAGVRAAVVDWDVQAVWEGALDDVSGHAAPPYGSWNMHASTVRALRAERIGRVT